MSMDVWPWPSYKNSYLDSGMERLYFKNIAVPSPFLFVVQILKSICCIAKFFDLKYTIFVQQLQLTHLDFLNIKE